MLDFIKRLFTGSQSTQTQQGSGVIVCQNSSCREQYDLDHVVMVSDEDMMSFLSGSGATVIGNLAGHPVLVDHSKSGTTNKEELKRFFDSAPRVGWTCNKCKKDSSWNASYRGSSSERPQCVGLILRDAKLKYHTSNNHATWGTGHSKLFDPSEFDPPLPAASLKYLLDGTLYAIPRAITSDTCREIVLKNINEAAKALNRAQGRASESEAAILTLTKLKLSLAVRQSETWDSAESKIDRIVRS